MGLNIAFLQIGYDLELQFNALKAVLPEDVVFERHCLIDYYIQKQLETYPRRNKKFFELYDLKNKRHVVNFHQFLPLFLLMYDNFKNNRDLLLDLELRFDALEMDRDYRFDMVEKMFKQTQDFLKEIEASKYDIICMGTTDGGVYNSVMAILLLRSLFPEKKIVIGGRAFKSYKELREILTRLNLIDTFVDGDGEIAINIIVDKYRSGDDLPDVIKEPVKKLDSMHFPKPGFGSFLWNNKNAAANIFSSRGCVNNCSFCNEGIYPFRCMSAERLAEYIKITVDTYETHRIIIADNLICPSKTYIEKFYKELERMKLVGKLTLVFVQIPIKFMDEDIIKMMKKLDARVFVGAESFSQNVLDRMDKETTVEQNIKVIDSCFKYELDIDIGRMAMFPGETMEDFVTSIRYFSKYLPKTVQSVWINVLALYSSTPLYVNPAKYDIKFDYFEENVQNIVPEVADIVARYPHNYHDLTDPGDEVFDRKEKMLKTVNEVLCMAFEKKWNKDYSHIK